MLIWLHVGLVPLIYSPIQNLSQVLKKTFQEEQNITVFLCLCLCLRSLRVLRLFLPSACAYTFVVGAHTFCLCSSRGKNHALKAGFR